MKKIIISDDRKLNISNVVIGYLQENKIEKLEFEIPKEYENFGRKACFLANGNTFTKTFDNITGNTITLTRDITQYQDLFMTIAFFKIEDEDEIIARTSTLHILIQDAVICDDDIKPDEPKVIILDNLITKVTNLDNTVTKNEEIREANETTRQQNETTREENEINRVNSEANREKAEESRKKAELERVSNENTRQSNEEERKVAENERVSNENAREEYINNLKAQVDNGDFDGADFNYKWDGTKLGVKNSKETTYQFVELKGQKGDKGSKGDKGDTGNGIQNIEKVSTVGNIDTYAINYTDGTQTTFDVTNGEVTKEQLDEVDNKVKNTRNELERVKNDVLETGTDTDTYIHLEDSAMAEYQELSVDGVCEQETTIGKNQIKIRNTNGTIDGITYSIVDDVITFNGTATKFALIESDIIFNLSSAINKRLTIYPISGTWNSSSIGINYRNSSDSQIGYIQVLYSNINKTTYKNINADTSTVVTSDVSKINFYVTTNAIFDNFKFKIQLEDNTTGSTSNITSYEPYTGGQPSPSPDYPQPISVIENSLKITSCNKNLLALPNKTIISNGVTSTIKNNELTIKGTCTQNWFKISENLNLHLKAGTYTFSRTTKDAYRYNFGVTLASGTNKIIYGSADYNTTFTIDEDFIINTLVSVTNIVGTSFDFKDYVQLEQGSQATSFEEHLQSQIIANLGNEFVAKLNDTYKDTLNVVYKEDGHYHLILNKMVGKVVLDGSEEGWKKSSITEVDRFSIGGITNMSTKTRMLISNYFKYNFSTEEGTIFNNLSNSIIINYMAYGTTTLEQFKNWLSTHNTEVYYALATPYEVDLGIVDTLLSYDEITNIFTDSDLLPTINAKYYRNFITTIQNLQVNEKALKQELIDINNRLSALETAQTSTTSESEVVE